MLLSEFQKSAQSVQCVSVFYFYAVKKKKKSKNSHGTDTTHPLFLTICGEKKKVHSQAESLHAKFSLGTIFYGWVLKDPEKEKFQMEMLTQLCPQWQEGRFNNACLTLVCLIVALEKEIWLPSLGHHPWLNHICLLINGTIWSLQKKLALSLVLRGTQ